MIAVIGIGCLVALFTIAPASVREPAERASVRVIDAIRHQSFTPRPARAVLNSMYDLLPSSAGFTVSPEISNSENPHFLAGQPRSQAETRVLPNRFYSNIFDEQAGISRCVAMRLTPAGRERVQVPSYALEDPRIRKIQESDLLAGNWSAFPIAPPRQLAHSFGQAGGDEAVLMSNFAPMLRPFAEGLWAELINELGTRYPRRFQDFWLYLGPVFSPDGAKLPSGVPIPDGFYAIAFHRLTDGSIRAIAFIVPQDADVSKLSHYIRTIAEIEEWTGLQFLPSMDPRSREQLSTWRSPRPW